MDATSPSDEATGLDEIPIDDIENAVRLWDIVWWVDDRLIGRRQSSQPYRRSPLPAQMTGRCLVCDGHPPPASRPTPTTARVP